MSEEEEKRASWFRKTADELAKLAGEGRAAMDGFGYHHLVETLEEMRSTFDKQSSETYLCWIASED